MFWVLMALLVIAAAVLVRRPRRNADADEPWRASLREEEDEPLDIDEIRRAEAEWLEGDVWTDDGLDDDGEGWR